jgi:hypothetical protein
MGGRPQIAELLFHLGAPLADGFVHLAADTLDLTADFPANLIPRGWGSDQRYSCANQGTDQETFKKTACVHIRLYPF